MLILIVKSFGSTNKGVEEFIISTLSSKERSGEPFNSCLGSRLNLSIEKTAKFFGK
jgi:hypothetical protein